MDREIVFCSLRASIVQVVPPRFTALQDNPSRSTTPQCFKSRPTKLTIKWESTLVNKFGIKNTENADNQDSHCQHLQNPHRLATCSRVHTVGETHPSSHSNGLKYSNILLGVQTSFSKIQPTPCLYRHQTNQTSFTTQDT